MNAENNKLPRNAVVLLIVIIAVLLAVGGFIFRYLTPNALPPEASAKSTQVDNLMFIMVAIGGAIFLLVQGAIVFSVIRFRAKPGDRVTASTCTGMRPWNWSGQCSRHHCAFLAIVSLSGMGSITAAKDNER